MKQSGILLHISSLPSEYGIGTLGHEAYRFADFLAAAGQHFWQMLPLGAPGAGNSPYHAMSAFAGNPLLIAPEMLVEDGLLDEGEADDIFWGDDPEHIDFAAVKAGREQLLHLAYSRFAPDAAFRRFCSDTPWLEDWAVFCAVSNREEGRSWPSWPEDIRLRRPEAMARLREEMADEIRYHSFVQYIFFRQWNELRGYLHSKGISVIGDVPIYVPLDSVDVWARPDQFMLDEKNCPKQVAGVPPDYFCEDGQLWGNPLYNWEVMAADDYAWWMNRLRATSELFDVVRIDHFRALASYWAVPYGETTARNGSWLPGPGRPFIDDVRAALPDTRFIAEDLGMLTPDVHELCEYADWPGMKVLQFAFDSGPDNLYLPHHYTPNCVCYTGTHDNETLVQWWDQVQPYVRDYVREYLHLSENDNWTDAILRAGMNSMAHTFITPIQDWLGLGAEGRMNTPGTAYGNWGWRMRECPDAALAARIREMTADGGRC